MSGSPVDGHAGQQAVAALRAFGVDTMFTLNGGHLWPLYEAARDQGVRIVDTRHEQSAAFAAEAYAKLTRRVGVAALTAGPGVTNGVSAITSAWFNGSPLAVLGGRAPQGRWGSGSLQELDHVPIVASITKSAATVTDPSTAGRMTHEALAAAVAPHRGPTFLDFPLDVFGPSTGEVPPVDAPFGRAAEPDPDAIEALARAVASASRPAILVGSDAYWGCAETELAAAVEHLRVPVFANGLGRGLLAADHELSFLRTRGLLKRQADLVVVVGTPLDFRLGFGRFGTARVAHVVDAESQRARHVDVLSVAGDIATTLAGLAAHTGARVDHEPWIAELRAAEEAERDAEADLLGATSDPIKPGRIYGELRRRLERDAVVICDGGDFASYAGKLV